MSRQWFFLEQKRKKEKENKTMNVLSLFDGISCGRVALERAGIKVGKYYASEIDKHAIKVSKKNWEEVEHLGDVSNWENWDIDFSKIDLLIAGSPCFVAGTPIVTKGENVPIENIQLGDKVLTHSGKYQKVLQVGASIKDVLILKKQGSLDTYSTSNHPFLTKRKGKKWNNKKRKYEKVFSKSEWKPLGELQKGDYVATPIIADSENSDNLTEEESFILGLYLGDGHTRKDFKKTGTRHWQLILSVGSHEKELLKSKVEENHFSCYRHGKSVHRFVFSNKRLVEIAEREIGCGSKNKTISKYILNLPKNLLQKFLEGYEFSDGSFRKNTYRATTVSKKIAENFPLLIAKLYKTTCCVEFNKRPKKTVIEGRLVNQSDSYTVSYRKYHTKQSRAFVDDGFVWNPVKEVVLTDQTKMVYNIEVEEDNSYIANTNVVHNCQGFSFAGKELAFDDPRSKLFFVFEDILNHIKSLNPNIKFLLENVRMKQEFLDIISERLDVRPLLINSALVSAQNRYRYYWANWNFQLPEDENVKLKDVIHETDPDFLREGVDRQSFLKDYMIESEKSLELLNQQTKAGKIGHIGSDSQGNRVYNIHGKSVTICASSGGLGGKTGIYLFGCISPKWTNKRQNGQRFNDGEKFYTLTTFGEHGILTGGYIRKLTPVECERLQTLPDNYTEGISSTQRYKALGNGWTVDVITHIFKSMNK